MGVLPAPPPILPVLLPDDELGAAGRWVAARDGIGSGGLQEQGLGAKRIRAGNGGVEFGIAEARFLSGKWHRGMRKGLMAGQRARGIGCGLESQPEIWRTVAMRAGIRAGRIFVVEGRDGL